jgi:hypothetical protein
LCSSSSSRWSRSWKEDIFVDGGWRSIEMCDDTGCRGRLQCLRVV